MQTTSFAGNNYPIAYYYPIAKDLVVISTGHDDSIIDDSMGYSEYIIPILEAIQSTSLKVYRLYLASITSTVTDYKGTHTWVFDYWHYLPGCRHRIYPSCLIQFILRKQ